MERRRPPETATGHYVLHDFRSIDWDRWRSASDDRRTDALAGLRAALDEATSEDGDLAAFSIIGHKADLLVLVLRPDLAAIDTFERRFQRLEFASFTTRETSAIGVTEASGYTDAAAAYFDDEATADPGIERYIETRLHPEIPDAAVVSYYPMSKRRDPTYNWYDLPYEERAAHVANHGEIGKRHAGAVTQLITGTVGFDDWEWGVTLFANEMTAIKDLLTEMRYDPSTSKYAEFGPFYVGRRFPMDDLEAFFAGDPIPTDEDVVPPGLGDELADLPVDLDVSGETWLVLARSEADRDVVADEVAGLSGNFDHYDSHEGTAVGSTDGETVVASAWTTERAANTAAGFLAELAGVSSYRVGRADADDGSDPTQQASTDTEDAAAVQDTLADRDVYVGQPHGEDVHALVLYSQADPETLLEAVEELRAEFDDVDAHRSTRVYRARSGDRAAVASLWGSSEAAEQAADRIRTLPGIESRDDEAGFGTMGLFYTVKPAHREDFISTFDDVVEQLDGMAGHLETDLLVNLEDERDTFIASRWRTKADALAFFRSDTFRETVNWGRDILADRPRHVFLA